MIPAMLATILGLASSPRKIPDPPLSSCIVSHTYLLNIPVLCIVEHLFRGAAHPPVSRRFPNRGVIEGGIGASPPTSSQVIFIDQ